MPNIDSSVIASDAKWLCRQCVFATTTKVLYIDAPFSTAPQTVRLVLHINCIFKRVSLWDVSCYTGSLAQSPLVLLMQRNGIVTLLQHCVVSSE